MCRMPTGLRVSSAGSTTKSCVIFVLVHEGQRFGGELIGRAILGVRVITSRALRSSSRGPCGGADRRR